ncbi:MAG: VOC family protein [Clostridiales bacterium]|nr:VOC family protein [Clostridiales bacterium]
MKIKELGHLAFRCRVLDESVRFYRDVMGFEKAFDLYYGDLLDSLKDRRDLDKAYLESLEKMRDKVWITYFKMPNGTFIELFDGAGASKLNVPGNEDFNYQHMSFVVEDIFAACEELKSKGVPIDSEPKMGMEHTWQMWTHDPDGNKIEFMQYTERSFQVVGRN